MSKLCPSHAQSLLRANDFGNVRTCAAIACEFPLGVKDRLAAGFHMHRSSPTIRRAVDEVSKGPARFEGLSNCPPFLRLCFQIEGVVPAGGSDPTCRLGTK